MTTQIDICERLATAPDADTEQTVLEDRYNLPPEMRRIPYEIRRLSDGRVLTAQDVSPDMASEIEVALFCRGNGEERELVWRPKSDDSLNRFLWGV